MRRTGVWVSLFRKSISTRFPLNCCSHSGMSEFNRSLRTRSWSSFLFWFWIFGWLGLLDAVTGKESIPHRSPRALVPTSLDTVEDVMVGEVDELEEDVEWSISCLEGANGCWRGENLEGWHKWLQTLRSWKRWTHRKSTQKKTQCKGSNISQTKWKIHFSSRRWTNKIYWRRSGTENIHFDTGPPNSRRRSKRFSWRIRIVSTSTTSRLISGCQWSDRWLLVHVRKLQKPPSRWTQSQALLAERRIIPYSTGIHWRVQNYSRRTWMLCKKAASMTIGIPMNQEICLFLEQVSLSLLYWMRNLQMDICGPGGDWQNGKRHPGQIIYGQNSGRNWQGMLIWGRSINGQLKNQSSIMLKNCEELISST